MSNLIKPIRVSQSLPRSGQAAARKELEATGEPCALTGSQILRILVAAHMHDHYAGGSTQLDNVFFLRADVHLLFDYNQILILPNGTVMLHRTAWDEYHTVIPQRLPETIYNRLHPDALKRRLLTLLDAWRSRGWGLQLPQSLYAEDVLTARGPNFGYHLIP